MRQATAARNVQLDVVRAVAILFVLGAHYPGTSWQYSFGWTGVDLFFVLSGFLVSGLLFDELEETGRVDAKRFLIRRGFKIYPAFWAMILATVIGFSLLGIAINRLALACELLFVQNIGPGLWAPTWSLAVEEHYYLGLAFVFAWMTARKGKSWLPRTPHAVLVLLVVVLVLRVAGVVLINPKYKVVFWGTHARIDALLFGSLLSYWHRYRSSIRADVERYRWGIVAGSLFLVAPAMTLGDKSLFTRTVGCTMLYLGFGGFLLVVLYTLRLQGSLSKLLATIGKYSYGIYIWHQPVQKLIVAPLHATSLLEGTALGFFSTSIVCGIVLSKAIEIPFLRLRERYFPARNAKPVPSIPKGAC